MSRLSPLVLAAAIGVQVVLSLLTMRGASATFDEGAHLPAGYTHLMLGDHRLNPEQPPLVKLLAAAPLAAVHPTLHLDDVAWRDARQWEFGRRFLYRWNDGDRLLFLGRLPIVGLASCLLVAVFVESRRRFGATAAAAAVALAAFSPDVLAHGSIVTTDLGFALFFFLSVTAFARCLEKATALRVLATGLFVGAAFATKLSAPILAIVLALLAGYGAIAGPRAAPPSAAPDPLAPADSLRAGAPAGRGVRLLRGCRAPGRDRDRGPRRPVGELRLPPRALVRSRGTGRRSRRSRGPARGSAAARRRRRSRRPGSCPRTTHAGSSS